jgi:hypothetical protein
MKRKIAALALLASLVAACATPTPYQPVTDGFGYFDQKLEEDRYRVTFQGNSKTERQAVEDYVLYRAAEVTLAHDFDYFVLVDHATNKERRESGGVSVGIGGFSFGSHSGMSLGLGTFTGSDKSEYLGVAEIVMKKGKKPKNDVDAFDAHEVLANLGPQIKRGPP